MSAVGRDEEIEQWLEDISGWKELWVESETEIRLLQAFRQVLQAMPARLCGQFLALRPVVLCTPEPAVVIDRPWGPMIYFAPTISRMTDQNLVDRVAHEIAHVILGHYRQGIGLRRSRCEAEEDELSRQWGFRPRYTKAMLRRLEAQEEK
jgi:hypothetical protein